MLRLPFIQIIDQGESIPFDITTMRTIFVSHTGLGSATKACQEIEDQIVAIEQGNSEIETPISVSVGLQQLEQSANPESQSLANVLSKISSLNTTVQMMRNELRRSEQRRRLHSLGSPRVVSLTPAIDKDRIQKLREYVDGTIEYQENLEDDPHQMLVGEDLDDRLLYIKAEVDYLLDNI